MTTALDTLPRSIRKAWVEDACDADLANRVGITFRRMLHIGPDGRLYLEVGKP